MQVCLSTVYIIITKPVHERGVPWNPGNHPKSATGILSCGTQFRDQLLVNNGWLPKASLAHSP